MMDSSVLMLGGGGAAALLVAVVAWLGDHRRMRRVDPDAVGFMPWTLVFFFALLAAILLLGLAARAWISGQGG